MNKTVKVSLVVIGMLLVLNGLANIFDDARVLTYDLTSIFSGIGFILISRMK